MSKYDRGRGKRSLQRLYRRSRIAERPSSAWQPLQASGGPDFEVVAPPSHAIAPPGEAKAVSEDFGLVPAVLAAHGDIAAAAAHQDLEKDLLASGIDDPVFPNAGAV